MKVHIITKERKLDQSTAAWNAPEIFLAAHKAKARLKELEAKLWKGCGFFYLLQTIETKDEMI